MYAPPIQTFCYVLRFSLTFIGVKWTPIDKLTQNLGFSIPFHLYIHDHERQWAGCTPTWGSDMYAPPIQAFCYIIRFSLTFIGVKWTPVDKLTQNLGFSIHFHLYIHDHERQWAGCTPTWGSDMYAPPIQAFWYILRFSLTFIGVKWTSVDKLTQNLGFSIPFHLYIHDHEWQSAGCTPTWGSDMYAPPIQAFCYVLRFSLTFIGVKWTPVDKLTQNLGFSIPFHLYIHDHERQWAGCTPTWGSDMYAPPIQTFCYVLRFLLTFIGVKWTPVDKLTQNLGFSIPFHLYIHDHEQQSAGCTPTWGSDMYAPPIQTFCYILRFSLTFIGVKWTSVDKLTQNLGFSIPFHLYIHDHERQSAGCTPTWGSDMYAPPIQTFCYIIRFSLTFIGVKRTPVDKLTQNLGFSIPFHLYIHDHEGQWAGCTPTWRSDMYAPPIQAFCDIIRFSLTFIGVKWTPVDKLTQNLGFSIPFHLYIHDHERQSAGCTPTWGSDMYAPPIQTFCYIIRFSLTFIGVKWTPVDKLTQNLGFSIPFHLYIHDHERQSAGCTPTWGSDMYAPPIQTFCYIIRFSLTFIGVKWTPVDKLTQNLGFSIPFHLYIHDHERQWAGCTPTWRSDMYAPPIQAFCDIIRFSLTFIGVKWTPVDKLTQNLGFSIPFHLYIHDHERQWAGCTPTWGSDMYAPPIQTFCYIIRFSLTFIGVKWTPVDKLTQNLGFSIPFHLYIHDHERQWAGCTPTWGSDMYAPPIQTFCYVLRFSFTFIGVKWTPVDKLTQNLGFSIPFHLYIHDHERQSAGCTPTWGSDMYAPPIQTFCYIIRFSLTFIGVKWTSVDKLTQNLGFSIPFHLYIHDHEWQSAGCTPTWGSDMYAPPIQAFCYVLRFSLTFIGVKWTPVDKLTQNLGFSIPFHLYIHDHERQWAGCTPTWGSDMYAPPIQTFCYVLRFLLTFIGVKWTPVDKLTQNLGFSIPFHLYIHDHEQQSAGCTPTWGSDMYAPPIQTFCYILRFSLTFIGVKWTSVDKLTQNLGFSIPFHLYIHDHEQQSAGCTPTWGSDMYAPPIQTFCYIIRFSLTFIGVKWTPVDKLTQNLGFSIPFHLYIHDHERQSAGCTPTWGSDMYAPPIQTFCYIIRFSLTFIGVKWTPVDKLTQNLGFSIPFHLYIHDHERQSAGCTPTWGSDMYAPPIQTFCYIIRFSLTFIGVKWTPVDKLTQNLGFSIPFHLYIHDHERQSAGCTPTWGSDMYAPPIQTFCYIIRFSLTFIGVKWTPVDKLTQNLGFSIPFHLYIHDHERQWAGCTPTWRSDMYAPPIQAFCDIIRFSLTFIGVKWTPVDKLTQNLGFSIPFHLYIHDHERQWAGCTPTWGSDMYAPPIQTFCYIIRFSLTFIGVKWTPVDKLTQNLGFSIPFHLYIHDHERQWAGCTPTWGSDMYAPPIQTFCYVLRFSFTFIGVKWTPVDKLTQNLGFSIPFHLYIHDHERQSAGCTPTWGSDMYAPPIQTFCYIIRFSLTFIGVKWTPVDKLTQNLGFSIPFHLYIHDNEWQWAGCTPTWRSDMYAPPIQAFCYILWFSLTFFGVEMDTSWQTNTKS